MYKALARSHLDYCDIRYHIPSVQTQFDVTLTDLMEKAEIIQNQAALAVTGFVFCFFVYFFMHFYPGTQSQLIQIYSVDWTGVYDTHNIEHRTEPGAIKVSAD